MVKPIQIGQQSADPERVSMYISSSMELATMACVAKTLTPAEWKQFKTNISKGIIASGGTLQESIIVSGILQDGYDSAHTDFSDQDTADEETVG